MQKILPAIFTICFLLVSTHVVKAIEPAGCDLCGRCVDAYGAETKNPDWDNCRKCIYDTNNTPLPGKSWTPIGCIDTNATSFIQAVLRFVFGIIGGLAFLGFLWGGFLLLTAKGDPGRIAGGKSTIIGAAGALFLVLASIFLMQFIGVQILALPGFGGGS